MSTEGWFNESSSSSPLSQIPDLSLQIRPPNSAPSISTATNEDEEEDSTFDIWQNDLKSHSHTSIKAPEKAATVDTELSLANPAAFNPEDESRQRRRRSCLLHPSQISHLNHGISLLDVSGFKPIKGIPVYNLPYFEIPYSSRSSQLMSSSYGAYRSILGAAPPRFNGGISSVEPEFQYEVGVGSSELLNCKIRSRFIPHKLHHQNKRNIRAPRMRWTSSLHARFVHAVELLGGHESKSLISCSFFSFLRDLLLYNFFSL